MSATLQCKACGKGVRVPKGYRKPKMLCPECGAVCDVSNTAGPWSVSAEPIDVDDDDIEVEPVTQADDDEDDDSPYELPDDGKEKRPCRNCRKMILRDAVVCAHCGYNRDTGETHERSYKPVDKEWEAGLPLLIRLVIFFIAGGMAFFASLIVGIVDGNWIPLIISWMIGMAMLAYAIGTYPRINLTRNRKGRVRLTKTWRFFFIPVSTKEINWREHEGVTAGQAPETDFWDLGILLVLLCCGLIPAMIWWWFMMQPGQFQTALTTSHGYPAVILYRGPSQEIALEIAKTIREVTLLP